MTATASPDLSPAQALDSANLNWEVEQTPLSTVVETSGQYERRAVNSHVVNMRSDTKAQLGVVSKGYTPVQNHQLAGFADTISGVDSQFKIAAAHQSHGGRKVWFLLRGQQWDARKSDTMTPFILLLNSHDGSSSVRGIPTTVRVFCDNQLHMVQSEARRRGVASFTCKHVGDMKSKMNDAIGILKTYENALKVEKELIATLASKDVTKQQIEDFWLDVYQRDFGSIPTNPANAREETKRTKALTAFNLMANRFDREKKVAGTTAWNAFNAYSGWLQHERPMRKDTVEARRNYNLFDEGATKTLSAFDHALAI